MEILILICLIVIIILLLQDKVYLNKKERVSAKKRGRISAHSKQEVSEIMGKPKLISRQKLLKDDNKNQPPKVAVNAGACENEIEKDDFNSNIPLEEPEDALADWAEEEEEWSMNREPDEVGGFAVGVTFEELDETGQLLEQEVLTTEQEQRVTNTIMKIKGTDIFHQLEESLDSVSQRIRSLLDAHTDISTDFTSSTMRDEDLKGFDITEFT